MNVWRMIRTFSSRKVDIRPGKRRMEISGNDGSHASPLHGSSTEESAHYKIRGGRNNSLLAAADWC